LLPAVLRGVPARSRRYNARIRHKCHWRSAPGPGRSRRSDGSPTGPAPQAKHRPPLRPPARKNWHSVVRLDPARFVAIGLTVQPTALPDAPCSTCATLLVRISSGQSSEFWGKRSTRYWVKRAWSGTGYARSGRVVARGPAPRYPPEQSVLWRSGYETRAKHSIADEACRVAECNLRLRSRRSRSPVSTSPHGRFRSRASSLTHRRSDGPVSSKVGAPG